MATTVTAITGGTPSLGTKGPRTFQGIFDVIPFTVTLTDATLPAQTSSQVDVTVTGAELDDFVLISPGVDCTALILNAYVSAANTVTITAFNTEGTDAVTSLSGGAKATGIVLKPKGPFGPLV